jgi:D-aspartate ligase
VRVSSLLRAAQSHIKHNLNFLLGLFRTSSLSLKPLRLRSAIVLCHSATGLAVVRALALAGVDVHAFVFDQHDPLWWSRYGTKVRVAHLLGNDAGLLVFLRIYARWLNNRPVVFPTGDAQALFLARHHKTLEDECRVWGTSSADMQALVHKDRLYELAARANVPVLPSIMPTDLEALEVWAQQHAGPYLLKPLYQAMPGATIQTKNQCLAHVDELMTFARQHGLNNTVVQRLIQGGDGEIYDTYGLRARSGVIVSMVSHRRWRQCPADLGSTCMGEIPSGLDVGGDSMLYELTRQLLESSGFHGIFGIEWLRDRTNARFYVIDFNARPFLTIGHVLDCGLNLPYLAFQELMDMDQKQVDPWPVLRRKTWIDSVRDISARRSRAGQHRVSTWAWLKSVYKARSYAYWRLRDPGPGLRRLGQFLKLIRS